MGMGYSNPPTDHCWNPIWKVAKPEVRDFIVDKIIPQYTAAATAKAIDGVFFDCFNYAYDMPTPWNRHATNVPNCTSVGGEGCEALLSGTLDLARRIAVALNAHGVVPMFSNPASFANPTMAPIWLDEQRLVDALAGTNYQLWVYSARCSRCRPMSLFLSSMLLCSLHLTRMQTLLLIK